jgi:replicative DNA helicase
MMPTAPERSTPLDRSTSSESSTSCESSTSSESRLAPHDLESEQAVLGAILVQPQRWHEAAAVLRAECFFRAAHQQIFAALAALDEARAPLDPLSLADELARARQLEAAGGIAYLTRLTDGVPRGVHVRYHAERVRDLWRKRQVIALAHALLDDAYDERRSADELSATAESGLIDLTRQVDTGDFLAAGALMAKTNAYLRRLASGESGVPSGFRLLDRLLGGFRAGEMVIVGGRPGDGKTSFALSIALHVAVERRLPVAIFSIEMSAEEVGMRLATALARVDASRVRDRRLSPTEHESLASAIARLEASPLFTDDSALITVAAMRARARRLKTTHGLALLIVDYVQLLVSERRTENRNAEVSVISRGLKILARDLQVPVIVLAQLNRQVMARPDKRPFLSDLRDSGALEQDADVVLFLFREELYHPEAPKGFAECIVAKARHAPTGTVPLTYLDHCTRFENHAGGR